MVARHSNVGVSRLKVLVNAVIKTPSQSSSEIEYFAKNRCRKTSSQLTLVNNSAIIYV